jgi:hypothetical protein
MPYLVRSTGDLPDRATVLGRLPARSETSAQRQSVAATAVPVPTASNAACASDPVFADSHDADSVAWLPMVEPQTAASALVRHDAERVSAPAARLSGRVVVTLALATVAMFAAMALALS